MATVKLSTIITDIAGTVGGVTFRRHGGQTVVSKKSRGPSRASSLGNARLPQMRTLITNWNALSQTVRDAWASAALNYTFPDKFGDQRNLSGRELYLKLQGNLIVTGAGALDPTTLASAITNGVNPVLLISLLPFDGFVNGGSSVTTKLSYNSFSFVKYDTSVGITYLSNLLQTTFLKSGFQWFLSFSLVVDSGSGIISLSTNEGVLINNISAGVNSVNFSVLNLASLYFRSSGSIISFTILNIKLVASNFLQAYINFDTVILGTTVLIQAQKLKNNAIAATFTRRQIIANKNMNASSLFDFSLQLLEKFPDIKQNDLIRIYITYMNASGFRSVPQVIETTVLE